MKKIFIIICCFLALLPARAMEVEEAISDESIALAVFPDEVWILVSEFLVSTKEFVYLRLVSKQLMKLVNSIGLPVNLYEHEHNKGRTARKFLEEVKEDQFIPVRSVRYEGVRSTDWNKFFSEFLKCDEKNELSKCARGLSSLSLIRSNGHDIFLDHPSLNAILSLPGLTKLELIFIKISQKSEEDRLKWLGYENKKLETLILTPSSLAVFLPLLKNFKACTSLTILPEGSPADNPSLQGMLKQSQLPESLVNLEIRVEHIPPDLLPKIPRLKFLKKLSLKLPSGFVLSNEFLDPLLAKEIKITNLRLEGFGELSQDIILTNLVEYSFDETEIETIYISSEFFTLKILDATIDSPRILAINGGDKGIAWPKIEEILAIGPADKSIEFIFSPMTNNLSKNMHKLIASSSSPSESSLIFIAIVSHLPERLNLDLRNGKVDSLKLTGLAESLPALLASTPKNSQIKLSIFFRNDIQLHQALQNTTNENRLKVKKLTIKFACDYGFSCATTEEIIDSLTTFSEVEELSTINLPPLFNEQNANFVLKHKSLRRIEFETESFIKDIDRVNPSNSQIPPLEGRRLIERVRACPYFHLEKKNEPR